MGGKRKREKKDAGAGGQSLQKRQKNNNSLGAPSSSESVLLTNVPFVETPSKEERKREGALYDLLGSEDETKRLQAAHCVICSLIDVEGEGEGDGVSEAVIQRHLNQRLFRGLTSGRNASRLGFSMVITEILDALFGSKQLALTRYKELTFEKVLGFLVDKTQATGNVAGQEERDHFLGQLFGLECFVRSGILSKNSGRWNQVLDLLLALGNRKIWLRSPCGWVIVQALELLEQADVEASMEKIAKMGLAKTPEGVAVWLTALKRFPEVKVKPWRNPLSTKSLGDLALIMKETFQASDPANDAKQHHQKKQAIWTAQLHFVWDTLLSAYIGGDASKTEGLAHFWARVVDGKSQGVRT